jgi:hypothetical protein
MHHDTGKSATRARQRGGIARRKRGKAAEHRTSYRSPMALRRSLILIPVLFLALCAFGPGPARAGYVDNHYVEPGTGLVLDYNIYVPDGYDPTNTTKKYPIMLVLHAANTNQIPPPRTLLTDGVGWSATFVNTPHQKTDPSFFMVPISQTNLSGWGEATDPITAPEKFEGRLAVLVLQQVVMTKYPIDPTRLYITGPSMGGRGTWDILRRYPGVFAAAAPAAAPALPTDAALYVNNNIWAVCGEVDSIVQGERDTITAIRALGGNPIYTELAGHGHDSWRWIYPDPQFVPCSCRGCMPSVSACLGGRSASRQRRRSARTRRRRRSRRAGPSWSRRLTSERASAAPPAGGRRALAGSPAPADLAWAARLALQTPESPGQAVPPGLASAATSARPAVAGAGTSVRAAAASAFRGEPRARALPEARRPPAASRVPVEALLAPLDRQLGPGPSARVALAAAAARIRARKAAVVAWRVGGSPRPWRARWSSWASSRSGVAGTERTIKIRRSRFDDFDVP